MPIRLVLAEKKLNFIDRQVYLRAREQQPAAYLKLKPNGYQPTLMHDGR